MVLCRVPTTRRLRDQEDGGGGTTLVEGCNGGRVARLRHNATSCRSCVMSEDVLVNVESHYSKKKHTVGGMGMTAYPPPSLSSPGRVETWSRL